MSLPKITARFGHLAVETTLAQPEKTPAVPATVAFAAPFRLSADDLWAALWYAVSTGVPDEDLADLAYVREMVADAIVNSGLEDAVNESHAQLDRLTPGTAEHVYALELREIAHRAFAPVLPTPPTPNQNTPTGGLAGLMVQAGYIKADGSVGLKVFARAVSRHAGRQFNHTSIRRWVNGMVPREARVRHAVALALGERLGRPVAPEELGFDQATATTAELVLAGVA